MGIFVIYVIEKDFGSLCVYIYIYTHMCGGELLREIDL